MDHDRLADLVGNGARRANCGQIVRTGIVFTASDFDSDDDVGVLFRDAEAAGASIIRVSTSSPGWPIRPTREMFRNASTRVRERFDDQTAETFEAVGAGRTGVDRQS